MTALEQHRLAARVARRRGVPAQWRARLAIALSATAVWLALPPLALRTPWPSAVIAVAAAALALSAARGARRRTTWLAVGASATALAGALALQRASVADLDEVVVWSALAAATLASATPLLFGALGGIIAERSGVMNIGLEGMMLSGAFFGIWVADLSGAWPVGLAAAVAAGAALALLHAVLSVHLRADQIVAGVGINFLALGLTGYLFVSEYGSQGTPPGVPAIPDVHLPLIDGAPFLGPALAELNLMVWVGLALVVVVHVFLFHTPAGSRMRAVSEHPEAAAAAGISVFRVRYAAVVVSGALAATGGAFLSLGFVHSFNHGMSSGRGFIALAAMIFGAWRPTGALGACLLFGFAGALALRLPAVAPSAATLFQALPYVLTLIAVAGIVGRVVPPAALGIPYRKSAK